MNEAQRERNTRAAPLAVGDASGEGYVRALDMLRACSTPAGFLASPTRRANYHRVWGRDGVVTGLAALLTGDAALIDTFRRTLITLAEHQAATGAITSNLDPETGHISYGRLAGRVDATLWFVIGCAEYARATGDDDLVIRLRARLERAFWLLRCWEFNERGLIYVPQTGDWADEYVHAAYVLYDQALYLQAHRAMLEVHRRLDGAAPPELERRTERLRRCLRASYWFREDDTIPDDVYHAGIYQRGRKIADQRCGIHWMPFFAPFGYGCRFDAFANVLVSLLDIADDEQRAAVDDFIIERISPPDFRLLPAFHPVVQPHDELWADMQMSFHNRFKNEPFEYHNGGMWPMITGFYVADLAHRRRTERAQEFLAAIDRANALPMSGQPWSFPEFVHGRHYTPGGTPHMAWSAAGAIIGHRSLLGHRVFRIT